jgi:hypothetical protein
VVTRTLTGRWLPVATLLGVLVAAGMATLLGGVHADPAPRPVAATGTVIGSTPCARAGARDTVVFVVDGRSYELPLDACGNPEGIRLDVELVTAEDGAPAARLAGAGASAPNSVIADRTAALLLALAGVAGALLVVLVRSPLTRKP